MAGRSTDLTARFRGEDAGFDRAAKSAAASAKVFEQELEKVDQARQDVAIGLTAFGAATLAGLGLAVKAAVEWESAFADVRKVLDGSPEQFAALEGELRGLARTLPATHEEIAATAAAAGQLGVAREDVAKFTRVMLDLGNTTNLTAEEAAVSLARLANVMGTSTDDVDRFGSALVALGNNSATTESEILAMASRISGAGAQIGLTEGEVLGFAAALSSVGIEAEAGGSAISRVMVRIEQAVRKGGDELEQFAAVSGMSAEQFRAAYQDNAAQGVLAFIQGLNGIQQAGGDVFTTLDDLGLKELRVRDALLRSASASDLLASSLRLGNSAWEENSALAEEAAQRYGTTEARLIRAKGSFADFAITLGQAFTPALSAAAEDVGTLLDMIGSLPPGVIQFGGVLTGIGGAAALLSGAYVLALPKIYAFNAALAASGPAGAAASRAIGGVATALKGPLGLALATGTIVLGAYVAEKVKARQRIDELVSTLDQETGAITENTKAYMANALEQQGLLEGARSLGLDLGLVTEAFSGNQEAAQQVRDRIAEVRAEFGNSEAKAGDLSRAIAGTAFEGENLTLAANGLELALNGQNAELEEARERQARLSEASSEGGRAAQAQADRLTALAEAHGMAAGGASEHMSSLEELEGEVITLDESIRNLNTALSLLFGEHMSVQEATDATEQAIADMAEETKKAREEGIKPLSESINANTQAGRDNRKAINDVIRTIADEAVARAEQGESIGQVTGRIQKSRDALIAQMVQMGYSRAEAEEYTRSLLDVPDLVRTTVETPGMAQARADADYLLASMNALDGKNVRVNVTTYRSEVNRDMATSRRGPVGQADGSVLRFYAGGGIEDHVAQIAPAGAWRVWAEPETGGEAYIPLSPAKRARSMAIWRETGRLLGAEGGGRSLTVNVRTDGTDGAERIAARTVRRVQEAETLRMAWAGEL